MKKCSKCKTPYGDPSSAFNRDQRGADGYRSTCKKCDATRSLEWAQKRAADSRARREADMAAQMARAKEDPLFTVDPDGDIYVGKIHVPGKRSTEAAKAALFEPQEPDELITEHKRDSQIRALKEEKRRLVSKLLEHQDRELVWSEFSKFKAKPIVRRERNSGMREAVPVILASDWHVEEPVELEKVNGANEYNLAIADVRIQRMVDGVLWMLEMHRQKFAIHDLVLWLGGDLMTGYIHEEMVESNLLSPVETILWLQHRLIAFINRLLSESDLETITIPCSYGNHGRTTPKSRISTGAENSFEWLMYQQLALLFKNEPRVRIEAPQAQHVYIDIFDFRLRFTHGDAMNYGGGIGGLSIPVNKAIAGWNVGRYADVTCFGHFHQYMDLPHAVGNGSLIGVNPYSIRIKAPAEPPQQSYFLMDSRRGKCNSTPIWVSDLEDEEAAG